MRARNKPKQKEAKVLIIRIKKFLLKFKSFNKLENLNLVFAPKIAPRETNKISVIYYYLIFTHPLL